MSSALEIFTGDRAPEDASRNTEFHEGMIARLVDAARDHEWAGAEFSFYQRREGLVSIGIKPGEGVPTIDDLRRFQEEQRKARLEAQAAEAASEQGSLKL